ncbi:MAG: peptidylprolyl isomerase [Anaerolineales bacterium]
MADETEKKPVIPTKKHVARLERERQQTRLIIYVFTGILVGVILLLAYGFLDINYLQLQKPVAKVGDAKILVKDFEARVRIQRQQLLINYNMNLQYQQVFGIDATSQLQQIQNYLDTPAVLGQAVLDQMINEELIRQEAAKRGITISSEELDKFIQAQFGYFANGTYTPTVTPTQFSTPEAPAEAFTIVTKTPVVTATLEVPTLAPTSTLAPVDATTGTPAAEVTVEPTQTATLAPTETATPTAGPTSTALPTATPYTYEGFQGQYNNTLQSFTKLGLTEESYRKFVENQLLRDKLKAEVTKDIASTDDQVWARHILVADEALALTIIEKLKAGEDFAVLAQEYSTDTSNKDKGGDLSWFGKGAMVPEFETAAFALEKPGDFTLTPVKSQFGYHIIQLIAKQKRPLDPTAYQTAVDNAFNDFVTKLRDQYTVETYDVWQTRVPTEPNFITMATDAADSSIKTATADAANQPTKTPKP